MRAAPIRVYVHTMVVVKAEKDHVEVFIALALHLDARLWTADDELKLGLRAHSALGYHSPVDFELKNN